MIIIFLTFFYASCSWEKERIYTEREMWYMARDVDPSIELVPITSPKRRILCKNYGPHCLKGTGRRILVNTVELITIAFENEKAAKKEALRIGQWYGYNWVFDDVTNEPVLEEFVQKVFKAKNAKKEWQDLQKK